MGERSVGFRRKCVFRAVDLRWRSWVLVVASSNSSLTGPSAVKKLSIRQGAASEK
jgi:hypothetical protein